VPLAQFTECVTAMMSEQVAKATASMEYAVNDAMR
jgi:hypothetical protein